MSATVVVRLVSPKKIGDRRRICDPVALQKWRKYGIESVNAL